MAEIKKFDLSRFLINQDFGFHTQAIAETVTCTDAKVTDLQTKYKASYTEFDTALKVGGKTPMTQQIADADKLQDDAYTGLSVQNKAMLLHFDPRKAEIANNVNIILRKYGDPRKLPYLQEDAVIKNVVQDLETFDNTSGGGDENPDILSINDENNRLATIGLREWVNLLKERNVAFAALYARRNAEDAAIQAGITKKTREATDTAYYEIIKRINSLADINGDAAYIKIIDNLNQLIDKEHASVLAHKTTVAKRNKKKEEEGGSDEKPDIL